MNKKVKKLYRGGRVNSDFLRDIMLADNDRVPGIFANKTEKLVFTAMYYGWLVANYRENWEDRI